VEAEKLQNGLHGRLNVSKDYLGTFRGELAVDSEKKSDARAVNELNTPKIDFGSPDVGIEAVIEMFLDGSRRAGIETRNIHHNVKGFATRIRLKVI
jgi:hypothetical protein